MYLHRAVRVPHEDEPVLDDGQADDVDSRVVEADQLQGARLRIPPARFYSRKENQTTAKKEKSTCYRRLFTSPGARAANPTPHRPETATLQTAPPVQTAPTPARAPDLTPALRDHNNGNK